MAGWALRGGDAARPDPRPSPSVLLPPAQMTVAQFAAFPLLISPVNPGDSVVPAGDRLCLTTPPPGAAGTIAVVACGVPGAAAGTAVTFEVANAGDGAGEGPALELRAMLRLRQALPGGPPAVGDGSSPADTSPPQCLAALGSVLGLGPCGTAAARWLAAPASPPRHGEATPPSGWTTHTGIMLANPSSGLCASGDGRLAACDVAADGRVFRLCAAPGACARFGVPAC